MGTAQTVRKGKRGGDVTYPETRAKQRKRRDAIKAKALELLRQGLTGDEIGKGAGADYGTICRWRHEDPAFGEAWDKASEIGTDHAEDIIAQCADKALNDPRYQTSLIFLLKNRRPEKWRDVQEHKHSGNVVIEFHAESLSAASPGEAE